MMNISEFFYYNFEKNELKLQIVTRSVTKYKMIFIASWIIFVSCRCQIGHWSMSKKDSLRRKK